MTTSQKRKLVDMAQSATRLKPQIVCAYGSCERMVDDVHFKVTVTITSNNSKQRMHQARYCCINHAAEALRSMARLYSQEEPEC